MNSNDVGGDVSDTPPESATPQDPTPPPTPIDATLLPITVATLKSNFEPNSTVRSSQLKKVIEEKEYSLITVIKAEKKKFENPMTKPRIRYVHKDTPLPEHWKADSEFREAMKPYEKKEEEVRKLNADAYDHFYHSFTFSELIDHIGNGRVKLGTTPTPMKFDDTSSKRKFFYKVIDDKAILESLSLVAREKGQQTKLFLIFIQSEEENLPTPTYLLSYVVYEDVNTEPKKSRRVFLWVTNAHTNGVIRRRSKEMVGGAGRSLSKKYKKSRSHVKKNRKTRRSHRK
jgi:hypothetical protein